MIRIMKRSFIAVLSMLMVFTMLTTTAFAGVNDLGVYKGAGQTAKIAEFETWLDRPMDYAVDFLASYSWTPIEGPNWALDPWKDSIYKDKLILSVPMLPDSGATLAEGASGAYDSHFAALAAKLVNKGMPNTILRIGWEMNGSWYTWAAAGKQADFVSYYKKIVTAMRSVPGQKFKFVWNPNIGSSYDLNTVYPGDSYVDFIGIDYYDQSWAGDTYPIPSGATAAEKLTRWMNAWNDNLTRPYGLNWFVSFAQQHNKPLVIPEWGVAIRSDGHGGGDNPYFIQWMQDWISSHNVAWHCYFDYNASDGNHLLSHPDLVDSGNKFKQLWDGHIHSGNGAAKAYFNDMTPSWKKLYQTVSAVPANTNYTASFWLKGTGKLNINIVNSSWSTTLATQQFTATSTWTKYTLPVFNTGSNTSLVFVIDESSNVAGTVYFDDCFLGIAGGGNKLANPGFEGGTASWTNTSTAVYTIFQK